MSIDLIIYGVVAAGLIVWLRSILGTRHGDERHRANPYVAPTSKVVDLDSMRKPGGEERTPSTVNKINELFENPTDILSIQEAAKPDLIEISKADRRFDIYDFLTKAQDAFAIVVEAFADGDRDTLQGLLTDTVYRPFDEEISRREEADEDMATDIHAIRKAEVLDAKLHKKQAFITVRFIAEETSVTRDKDGEIITGHPDKVTEMNDIWIFGRDIRSSDPRWWVHETRGGFEEDNDSIPNSH